MMEVGSSTQEWQTEAKKLADTLETLANHAQAVQEVLHSVKFPEAQEKLHRDYNTLRAKITTLEKQMEQEIESFKIERIVRVNNIAQLIKSARQRAGKALGDLEQAKEMGDQQLIRQAEHAVDAIDNEIDCHSLSVELQSLKNVDLVAPEKYAAVEAFLNRPLHFLKTSTLSPTDLSLSVLSERISAGQPVEIEISQTRGEKRIMELLSVRVQDSMSNDVPKWQDLRQRVGGGASVVVKFTPRYAGRHIITVLIYGEHVSGSPMSLVVEQGEPHPPAPATSYEPIAPSIVLSSTSMARLSLGQNRPTNASTNSAFRPIGLASRSQPVASSNGFAAGGALLFSKSLNASMAGFGRGRLVSSPQRITAFNESLHSSAMPRTTPPTHRASVGRQNVSPTPSAVGMLIDIGNGTEEAKNVNGQSVDVGQQQLSETTMTTESVNAPSIGNSDNERSALSRKAELSVQGHATSTSNKSQNEDWDALPTASQPSNGLPTSTQSRQQTSPAQTPLPLQMHKIKTEFDADGHAEGNGEGQPTPVIHQRQPSHTSSMQAMAHVKVKTEADPFYYQDQHDKTPTRPSSTVSPPIRPPPASSGNRVDLLDMYEKSARKGIVGTQTLVLGVAGRDSDAYVHLSKPIGCTYDERSNQWIVCDTGHNMIKLFDADGRPNTLLKDGLTAPSAAVVVEPGRTFAIKDDVAILLYDQRTGSVVLNVAEHLRKPMGLALDGEGRLVTLSNAFHGTNAEIQSFDVRAPLQSVSSFPYRSNFTGNPSLLKPRFIAADGDLLAVTDLGVDLVFLMSLKDGSAVKTFGGKSGRPGEFMFVSGVRFDGAHNLLIGDAKGNRVQLFDASGTFKCRVEASSPIGFVSDLHFTDDGRLMCLDRGKNIAKVYQLAAHN